MISSVKTLEKCNEKEVSIKKLCLNISQYSQGTPVLEYVFNKVYSKETQTQVFSCKYCKIFKSICFEHSQIT